MPTYVGLDCTVNSSEPHKVFPTRAMIRELLLEENKRISERWGLSEVLIYEIIEGFSLYNPLIEALISYVEYYPNLIVG